IFPDGGVARLRAYGRVEPNWEQEEIDEATHIHVTADAVDLVALKNGGVALACSDAHFGPMNNLLLPGRAADMGGGWETRRRRGSGHDWVILQPGARGVSEVVEVDPNHFKGNFPARCSLDLLDAPAARIPDIVASPAWVPALAETRLEAHKRHFFRDGLRAA